MRYLSKEIVLILLLAMFTSSCSVFKKNRKENNPVPKEEFKKDQAEKEGQNLDEKQNKKLEKLITKIEDEGKKRTALKKKLGENPSLRMEKKVSRKINRSIRKELSIRDKIKKFHHDKNMDNQHSKTKKRMKEHT